MTPINLIPTERLAARSVRKRVIRWGVAAGAYTAVVAAACVGLRMAAVKPDGTFDAEMRRASDRIDMSTRMVIQMETELARLQRQVDAAATVSKHPEWSLLLSALAQTDAPVVPA